MALTRSQLLMSSSAQGVVLPGQPVAVTAGAGITIDPNTGVISVNAASVTGLVKLNNPSAYNAYAWPGNPGTNGQFLQTNGAGILTWAAPSGFAVVTVQSGAPTPADVGELWFDCATGTLNVYQNCVGTPSPNWFNVAQPGLPVLPANTNAAPPFTGGNGTLATPYDCTVTTTGAGTTVYVINTVTVVGLAPFQYVPIVDLNAVINGGRFTFSNYYADATGSLTFQTIFNDQPPSVSGTVYNAAIKVGYGTAYIDATVNVVSALVVSGGSVSGPLYVGQQLTYTPGVPSGGSTPYGSPTIQWLADGVAIGSATNTTFTLTGAQLGKQITASTTYTDASSQTATGTSAAVGPVLANPGALTITSPGSIAPTTASIGATLNYTAGTFTGGIPTVTPSWRWQRAGVDIAGVPANATSYVTVGADAGQAITVRFSVTDSSTPTPVTQSASTPAVTPTQPFPSGVWDPTPAGAMNANNPGTSSGVWNGPAGTVITATGCVEVSIDGINYSTSVTVTNPQVLYQRWKQTPACGTGPTGTAMTGTVTDGTNTNSYALSVNRLPAAFTFTAVSGAALGSVQASNSVSITGLNSPAYVTYGAASTGTVIQGSTDGGTTWVSIPASGTTFPVANSDNLLVRLTTSSTPGGTNTAVINIGDGDNVQQTASTFTVTNTTSAAFPGLTFNNGGAPNAAPDTVSAVVGGGALGTLNGVADSNSWPAGFGTTLSSPGGTPTMKFRVNGAGGYVTSGLSVNPTDVLNLAWNQAYLDTVADGATATGTITGTVSATAYTNTFTMAVKRSASWTAPTATGAALSTQQTTNPLTVNNFNVPVTVSFAAPTGPAVAMTSVVAVVGGVTTNITLGTTTVTLNPGQTFEVLGTTGATGGATYGVAITIGTAAAQDWLVTTSAVPNAIQAPVMSPTGGPLNPALNSPAGITLGGGTYTIATGAPGPHTSSDWELYKAVSYNPTTSAITNVGTVTQPTYSSGPTSGTAAGAGNTWVNAFNGSLVLPGAAGNINSPAGWNSYSIDLTGFNLTGTTIEVVAYGSGGVAPNYSWGFNGTQATAGNTTNVLLGGGYARYTLTGVTGLTALSCSADAQIVGAYVDGLLLVDGGLQTQLTLTDSTDLADMVVGDRVKQNNATTTTSIPLYQNTTNALVSVLTGPDNPQPLSPCLRSAFGTSYTVAGSFVGGATTVKLEVFTGSSPTGPWFRQGSLMPGASGIDFTAPGYSDINTYPWIGFDIVEVSPSVGAGNVGYNLTVPSGVSVSPSGTITAINSGSAPFTLTLSGVVGTFTSTNTAIDISRTVLPPAPTTDPPNATKYTQVVNVANDASNLVTYLVAQSLLTTSSTYYSRARYKASSTSTTSPWANWASFSTVSSFVPAPGSALNGGFFGGQINDGGIVYNLIVGPVASAQAGGSTPTLLQWKNAASADTPSALWQNQAYGFPASQAGFAGGAATYPALHFARSVSTGGFNDWYLPARNELAVLYFFLKPNTQANDTTSGANGNSIAPYTPNSNYGVGFPSVTTATDFISGGTQAFTAINGYWTSSQSPSQTSTAFSQRFGDSGGYQAGDWNPVGDKVNPPWYARAIRREYANAPVAIGAAFGGGFFAGQYVDPSDGLTYNLIVADASTGQNSSVSYKTSNTANDGPSASAQNSVYGKIAQDSALTNGTPTDYPAFNWADGLTIATFSDWYIPSKNELAILVYNLGPSWTTSTTFQSGVQALLTAPTYLSATENSGNTGTISEQTVGTGSQGFTNKNLSWKARAVRRQLA